MNNTALELDIRPLCAVNRPPLDAILEAVSRLQPGQPFRLIAPFKPEPLFPLLGKRGLSHNAAHRNDGAWEIVFTPARAVCSEGNA